MSTPPSHRTSHVLPGTPTSQSICSLECKACRSSSCSYHALVEPVLTGGHVPLAERCFRQSIAKYRYVSDILKLSASRTSQDRTVNPSARAATGDPLSPRVQCPDSGCKTATREVCGTASLSSSSRLPPSSLERFVMPVTLPPGRARLSTRPASTGSTPAPIITMGIVLVAFLAARIHGPPPATTIISTLRRTNSAASSGRPIALSLRISVLDGNVLSLYVPKLAQSLPNCLGRADSRAGSAADRYPIRGTFFGCCASALAPHT